MPTYYTLAMAVVWFSLLGGVLMAARRRSPALFRFGLWPVLLLGLLPVVRVFFAFEPPHALVLGSRRLLVWLQRCFRHPLFSISLGRWLVAIWLLGAGIGIGRFWFRWAEEMKRLKALPRDRSPLARRAAKRAAGRELDIIVTPETQSPYIVGFFKPTVLLPDYRYTAQSLELILRHEYQHFLNRDQWKKTLAHMARLFLWWNPLAVLVCKELDQVLEMCCDYKTLQKLPAGRRGAYFDVILDLCRQAAQKKESALSTLAVRMPKGFGFDSKTLLHQRIQVGLALQKPRPLKDRIGTVLICIALVAVFIFSYTFVIQPQFPAPEMEDGYIIFGANDFADDMILVERADGLYEIYADNTSLGTIQDISWGPFASAPVIPEEVWKWGNIL